ncbi:MAG: hypothetical protein ACJA04_001097, partial [Cellvibrionaceae bacterium]
MNAVVVEVGRMIERLHVRANPADGGEVCFWRFSQFNSLMSMVSAFLIFTGTDLKFGV